MSKTIKILMVCLGNICRSPMAQGILEHKAKINGLKVKVDSAGTSSYHKGERPDIRSIKKMNEYNIDISNLRARPFVKKDLEIFDKIYAMDYYNLQDIKRIAGHNEKLLKKVDLILNELFPGENRSIPDPYYGLDDSFEYVFQLLDKASNKIIEKIKNNTLIPFDN